MSAEQQEGEAVCILVDPYAHESYIVGMFDSKPDAEDWANDHLSAHVDRLILAVSELTPGMFR